jgi:hypothetical protein
MSMILLAIYYDVFYETYLFKQDKKISDVLLRVVRSEKID